MAGNSVPSASKLSRSFENDSRIAAGRVESLSASLEASKKQATSTNGQDVQLRALEREAKAQRDLLDSGELDHLLNSPRLQAAFEQVLESEGAKKLVDTFFDSGLFDRFVDRLLASDGLWHLVDEIAGSPAVMAAGPVVYSTLSSRTVGDATAYDVFALSGDPLTNLVNGDNVLAVEVHNYNQSSPDITFGTALLETQTYISAPRLNIVYGIDRFRRLLRSPLPLGEVAARSAAGEGLRSIESPNALTPTLSPREREHTFIAVTVQTKLHRR